MKYNPGVCMKDMINDMINDIRNDMKNSMILRNARGVVLNDNENEKMLGPHTLLCDHALGIPLIIHDSTSAYVTRQGNNHYVYYNAAMIVAIPDECPTSTATRECSPVQKRAQEVCEPTGGSILTRMNCV